MPVTRSRSRIRSHRSGLRPCSTPGCPELVEGGPSCPAHVAEARRRDEERRPRSERRYGPEFERNRAALLADRPLCACGCGRLADTADHWPVTRRELLAQGVADPDARHRLRPLFHACHNRESAQLPRPRDDEGWGGTIRPSPPSPLGSAARGAYGSPGLS